MKKNILALMALVATMNLNAQFVLTPNNFVLENDASKNYEVLYFDSISKHDLYRFAKSYLEGIFNNPQKVLNCTEDDHIIVDYEGDSFSVSGGWSWAKYDVCYKYTFEFKDGKIRVIPFFKNIVQRGGQSDGKIIPLIGSNFMGKDAVFGEKSGKCIFKKGKQMAENETNAFIAEFANGIKKAKSDSDW